MPCRPRTCVSAVRPLSTMGLAPVHRSADPSAPSGGRATRSGGAACGRGAGLVRARSGGSPTDGLCRWRESFPKSGASGATQPVTPADGGASGRLSRGGAGGSRGWVRPRR
jgi:hypothetical protein